MDPALVQALSLLIGTVSSAILIIVNYYFGGKRRDQRDDHDDHDHEE